MDTFILDDSEFDVVIYSPVCLMCKHLFEGLNVRERRCKAFPDEIPLEIWNGDNLHTEVYKSQKNDIIFESR